MLRRTTSLTALAATFAAPVLLAGPTTTASVAAPSCGGERATIVGTPGEPVVGTPGRDLVVTNGATQVSTLGGDDVVCLSPADAPVTVLTGAGDDEVRGELFITPGSTIDFGAGTDRLGMYGERVTLDLEAGTLAYSTEPDAPTARIVGLEDASILGQVEVVFVGDDADNDVRLGPCTVRARGGAGDDRIQRLVDLDLNDCTPSMRLNGGPGRDVLEGSRGPDALFGGPGHDRLLSRVGPDRLVGGPGPDRMDGGRGHDRLVGGTGRDRADGGQGRDTCRAEVRRACER